MNVTALFALADLHSPLAWRCGVCARSWAPHEQAIAEACCRCADPTCTMPSERENPYCKAHAKQKAFEEPRPLGAHKPGNPTEPLPRYGDAIYCDDFESGTLGRGLWRSIDELLDHCLAEGLDLPDDVCECRSVPMQGCANSHIGETVMGFLSEAEMELDDPFAAPEEDEQDPATRAMIRAREERLSPVRRARLQMLLDAWWQEVALVNYEPDERRYVEVTEAMCDAARARHAARPAPLAPSTSPTP